MRVLLFLTLLLPLTAFAAEIQCFSGKTRIYHGWGDDIVFEYDYIGFVERNTGHVIIAKGDCIVFEPTYTKGVNDAVSQRKGRKKS